jgi:drug/metabolite transporter (DMT)-like permease
MKHRNPVLGAFMILMATFLFGLNGSTAKTVMATGVSAEQITLFRSLSACLIAGVFMLVRNPSSFKVSKSEWKWLILLGTAGVGLMQWSYANAVANLPVGVALLIQYTAIILVPITGMVLFKNRVSPRLWLGVGLVLGGLVVVSHIGRPGSAQSAWFMAQSQRSPPPSITWLANTCTRNEMPFRLSSIRWPFRH